MNSEPLEKIAAFLYLGCTVTYNNNNWSALYHNLRKAQRQWEMVRKVVLKTEAKVQSMGKIYNTLVQLVLLYRSESWVVIGEMLKVLEGFHHRVARRIMGMMAQNMTVEEGE